MTAAFDPGILAHRVTIQRPVATPDGAGGAALTWEALATVWAAIDPVSAREDAASDRLATRLTHRITVRFRADLAGGMRIAHRGRSLRITAWRDPDETRRFLVLDTEEERP
ncbi:phage head closure protein [Kaistia dalseonensis]|uniref:SPP1 family predicted phage head-tail adaptor n=1 Tax=Kaistia dalseonensis TaxID=410840 RepID=A0ABU0HD98_9HYPH|nr:phage head closure protein [Kaistia dalseonensis]MCX5497658.1 phage head closure protein [Kaistia dalseonensis]MDQ0440302.1 SPP1 family predicted phage head-tail adaptor [Kaistia dalseonensis]